MEKLCHEIDVEQLPEEFGGKLKYDHESWIKFRTVSILNFMFLIVPFSKFSL